MNFSYFPRLAMFVILPERGTAILMPKEAGINTPQGLQRKLEGFDKALERFDRIVESRGEILFMPKVSRIHQEPDYETRLRAVIEVAESRDRVVWAISREGGLRDRLEERKKALAGSMSLSLEPPREPPSEEYIRQLVSPMDFTPANERIIGFLLAEFQEGAERQSLAKRVFENKPAYTASDRRLSNHISRIKRKLKPHGVTIAGIQEGPEGSTRYVFRWYREPVNSSGKPPVISRTPGAEKPVIPPNGSQRTALQVDSDHETPKEPDIHSNSLSDTNEMDEVTKKIGSTWATTLLSALVRSNRRLDEQYIPQLPRDILSAVGTTTTATAEEQDADIKELEGEEARKTAFLVSAISSIEKAWRQAQSKEIGDWANFRNIQYCSTLANREYSLDEVILLICSHFQMEAPVAKTPTPANSILS